MSTHRRNTGGDQGTSGVHPTPLLRYRALPKCWSPVEIDDASIGHFFRLHALRALLFFALAGAALMGCAKGADVGSTVKMVKQGIGGPCAGNGDCEPALVCLLAFPGGLCSRNCNELISCGDAAICSDGKCYQACRSDEECTRGGPYVCTHGACETGASSTVPHCSDGRVDVDETDIDCGGPTCLPCADGRTCVGARDCQSSGCAKGSCSHCANAVRDLDESDVNCGGAACPACGYGFLCGGGADCLSGTCVQGVCAPPPHCADGKKDVDESDVDCGGATCLGCAVGLACAQGRDCQSFDCIGKICIQCPNGLPACCDGKMDHDESDIDCGGASCVHCPAGKGCQHDTDCEAYPPGNALSCIGGLCACQPGLRFVKGAGCVCDPQSCGQCCSPYGCGPPQDGNYCGRPGEACVPCNNGGFGCYDGVCLLFCGGHIGCDNCCVGNLNGACIGWDDDSLCGKGGTLCAACPKGKHCVKGACQ